MNDYDCLVFIGLFASRLTADRRAARRMHRGSYPGEVDFASKVNMPKRRCDPMFSRYQTRLI